MRRTAIRSRPQADPVTPELYRLLMGRDRGCVLARLDPTHRCIDRWGYPAHPWDPRALSVEHVKRDLRAGRRAKSIPAFTVIICLGTNVKPPSEKERAKLREYLAERYPEAWSAEGGEEATCE